jgi:DNA-binding transcriptional LysR family regulator
MDREPGPLLDLRRLSYFVAVAEELHFGRAAERLYVAQPVLSRQVRKLEHEIGTDLLLRSSRNVELTPAGLQVLDEAKHLLATAERARRRIADIACGQATLTIGFFVGDEFTAPRNAFSTEHPDVTINLLRIYWDDQTDVLHDGRADIAFVHLPIDDEGLEMVPVRSEPRVAVLPANHPAASKHQISITELADDPVIVQRGASPSWQAFHNVDPRPDGRQPRPGPEAANLEEKLQHVAAGRAISFVPSSVATAFAQSGIAYVPVTDVPPIQICLAWKTGRNSPLIQAFADATANVDGRPKLSGPGPAPRATSR